MNVNLNATLLDQVLKFGAAEGYTADSEAVIALIERGLVSYYKQKATQQESDTNVAKLVDAALEEIKRYYIGRVFELNDVQKLGVVAHNRRQDAKKLLEEKILSSGLCSRVLDPKSSEGLYIRSDKNFS